MSTEHLPYIVLRCLHDPSSPHTVVIDRGQYVNGTSKCPDHQTQLFTPVYTEEELEAMRQNGIKS
jgi:hypothetical protein